MGLRSEQRGTEGKGQQSRAERVRLRELTREIENLRQERNSREFRETGKKRTDERNFDSPFQKYD